MKGDLRNTPFEEVLRMIDEAHLTGKCGVRRGDKKLVLYFVRGDFVALSGGKGPILDIETLKLANTPQEKAELLGWARSRMMDVFSDLQMWSEGEFQFAQDDHLRPPFLVPIKSPLNVYRKVQGFVSEWLEKGRPVPPLEQVLVEGPHFHDADGVPVTELRLIQMLKVGKPVRLSMDALARNGLPKVRNFLFFHDWRKKGLIDWRPAAVEAPAAAGMDSAPSASTNFLTSGVITLPPEVQDLISQMNQHRPLSESQKLKISQAMPAAEVKAAQEFATKTPSSQLTSPAISSKPAKPSTPKGPSPAQLEVLACTDLESALRLLKSHRSNGINPVDEAVINQMIALLPAAAQEGDWDALEEVLYLYLPANQGITDEAERGPWLAMLRELFEQLRAELMEYDLIAVTERILMPLVDQFGKAMEVAEPALQQLLVALSAVNLPAAVYSGVTRIQEHLEENIPDAVYGGYVRVVCVLAPLFEHKDYVRLEQSLYGQARRHFLAPVTEVGIKRKRWALEVIARCPGDEPLTLLFQAIENPHLSRRAGMLLLSHQARASRRLLDLLRESKDRDVRLAIIETLQSFEADFRPELLRWLKDPLWYIRRNALSLLKRVGETEDLPAIKGMLEDDHQRVVEEAVRATASLLTGQERDEFLMHCWAHLGESYRPAVAGTIGEIGGPIAYPFLRKQLQNKALLTDLEREPALLEIVRSLCSAGRQDAIKVLKELSEEPVIQNRSRVLLEILRTLSFLFRLDSLGQVVEVFRQLSQHQLPNVAQEARLFYERARLGEDPNIEAAVAEEEE